VRAIGEATAEGFVFRVDLRLRPEGDAGALARSLESCENYYAAYGETWERMALMKARAVAGDPELGYEFHRAFQGFSYPASVPQSVLDEIARLKERIEREVVGPDRVTRHVKLGRGGIREIEFIVQTFQLLQGARFPTLQQASTLKALRAIVSLELMPPAEARRLTEAYELLRSVEHRLQMINNQQTHTIPEDPAVQGLLARSLGFESADTFQARFEALTGEVRKIYEDILKQGKPTAFTAPVDFRNLGFWNPADAEKIWRNLENGPDKAHVGPRVQQNFQRMVPGLVRHLPSLGNPDLALFGLERFVEAYGARAQLYETLSSNPKVLELFLRIFDGSPFLTRGLIRHPELFEDVARSGTLDAPKTVARYLAEADALKPAGGGGSDNPLAVFRLGEILRITLRDFLGLADPAEISAELSDLAEACLRKTIGFALPQKPAAPFCVMAWGRFGGRELTYGSSLDILFVGEPGFPAGRILERLTAPTSDGPIWPADARLRPGGESAPLLLSLDEYRKYYAEHARTGDRLRLARIRPVAGDPDLARDFIRLVAEQCGLLRENLPKSRDDLRQTRMDLEQACRGRDDFEWDFKMAPGGLLDIEWTVQFLQVTRSFYEPNIPRAIEELWKKNLVEEADTRDLREGYLFLRRIETCLRRFYDVPVSALPQPERERLMFFRRLGVGADDFTKQFHAVRKRNRELFEKYV